MGARKEVRGHALPSLLGVAEVRAVLVEEVAVAKPELDERGDPERGELERAGGGCSAHSHPHCASR